MSSAYANTGLGASAIIDPLLVKGPKGDKGDKGDTGEQGPKGDSGATTVAYPQPSPSDTWVITHEFGTLPVVFVADSAGDVVLGDIEYTAGNVVTIRFAAPFSGTAYLR